VLFDGDTPVDVRRMHASTARDLVERGWDEGEDANQRDICIWILMCQSFLGWTYLSDIFIL